MDNLSAHKVSGIRKSIETTGAELIYLPPYSPDLTPIELFWSKVKWIIKKYAARTFKDLKYAISRAFKEVTESDFIGWFKYCGYCTH